jgi:DNA-binding transcriptional MerR regulator
MARLLPAELAALAVGVKPGTLRVWRHRGHLKPAGGTERRPLYALEDLHAAKRAASGRHGNTRQNMAA